jgi:hypothetical protein
VQMPRLGPCLAALRDLAKSNDPHRHILVERHIDKYLRTDPFSLAHALERLRRAIHYEDVERREGEDCARDYVRSLLHRMTWLIAPTEARAPADLRLPQRLQRG